MSGRSLSDGIFRNQRTNRTNDLIGIIIFAALSVPLILVPPENLRKPFLVGSIIITIATTAIFIWAIAKEGGGGPLLSRPSTFVGVTAPNSSAKLGWAMAYGISSTIGSTSAGILNQSDYTRFATCPRAQILSQLIVVPVSTIIIALYGVIVTSCAADFYPEEGLLWAPYDLLEAIQMHGGPGARAACFFAGCAFVLSQFGINIPGNALSGGIDIAGLLPQYIDIRRCVPMCTRYTLGSHSLLFSEGHTSPRLLGLRFARGSC